MSDTLDYGGILHSLRARHLLYNHNNCQPTSCHWWSTHKSFHLPGGAHVGPVSRLFGRRWWRRRSVSSPYTWTLALYIAVTVVRWRFLLISKKNSLRLTFCYPIDVTTAITTAFALFANPPYWNDNEAAPATVASFHRAFFVLISN